MENIYNSDTSYNDIQNYGSENEFIDNSDDFNRNVQPEYPIVSQSISQTSLSPEIDIEDCQAL